MNLDTRDKIKAALVQAEQSVNADPPDVKVAISNLVEAFYLLVRDMTGD